MLKNKTQSIYLTIAALCSSIFAWIKFNPCRLSDFSSASVTLNACYSDIPIFWKSRLLEVHLWPYSYLPIPELSEIIPPIEYPVILGTIIWLLSFITPQDGIADVNFFDVNAIFIVLLFAITNFYLYKVIKNKVFFFLFAPAVFFSLFINWDMWAVLPTIMAIYYFDRKNFKLSSVLLAIATASKFYPIVLLLPIICILVKRDRAEMGKFLVVFVGFYSLINLPYILSDFGGWKYFFEFSFNRGIGYGSVWEAAGLLGLSISNLNQFYTLTTMIVFMLVTIYYLKYADIENLYSIAFFAVFAFTVFSKVYSPQYVLWLTPLAVLALRNQKQINFYFVWQAFELIYHFAIWRYIYWLGLGGKIAGLAPEQYSIISLLRMFSLIVFTLSLAYPQIRKINKVS